MPVPASSATSLPRRLTFNLFSHALALFLSHSFSLYLTLSIRNLLVWKKFWQKKEPETIPRPMTAFHSNNVHFLFNCLTTSTSSWSSLSSSSTSDAFNRKEKLFPENLCGNKTNFFMALFSNGNSGRQTDDKCEICLLGLDFQWTPTYEKT